MQWIHIINLIYVAYNLNVSVFDQIGKFTRNFIAKYVSHLLKTRQLQISNRGGIGERHHLAIPTFTTANYNVKWSTKLALETNL